MAFLAIELSIGRHGGGTNQWNVPYKDVQYNWRVCFFVFSSSLHPEQSLNDDFLPALQYSNYGDVIYSLALLFTKLSILLLILRVFCSVQHDGFYWLTQSLIFVNSLFYAVYFFIPIFSCLPRHKIWNPEAKGKCLEINGLYYSS